MDRISEISLDKIMNMNQVEKNLIVSSLYLSAFEILKISIVDDVKGFFSQINGKELVLNEEEYGEKVLKLDKNAKKRLNQGKNITPYMELNASCLWLKKMDAINKSEIDEIHKIRRHRNEIAHELPKLLIDSTLDVNIEYLLKIKELLNKIDNWWIIEVEIPILGLEISDGEEVKTGRMMILDHILSILI